MSTHRADVFRVEQVTPHPNGDRLDIVRFAGYQTCVGRGQFHPGDIAVFVSPDSLVDVRNPLFSFLADQAKTDGFARIKAKKLRGVVSFGLVVPAPKGLSPGDDAAPVLGIQHYEPPLAHESRKGTLLGGDVAPAPVGFPDLPRYDLENFRHHHDWFAQDEVVVVSEKLDGCFSAYLYWDGQMHCKSRSNWKKEFPDYSHLTVESLVARGLERDRAIEAIDRVRNKTPKRNIWWEVLRNTPALEKFCRDNPGVVVCGELFGNVNCIKYGLPEVNRFAAFDTWNGDFLDPLDTLARANAAGLAHVPVIRGAMPYSFEEVCELAEGNTLVDGSRAIREGCVISPVRNRTGKHGRVKLKCVSAAYLERYR